MTISVLTRERVVALAKQGIPPRGIRVVFPGTLGIYDIYGILQEARKTDRTIPNFKSGNRGKRLYVELSPEVLERLYDAAQRRKITTTQISADLLTALAIDGLIDAVLDDRT